MLTKLLFISSEGLDIADFNTMPIAKRWSNKAARRRKILLHYIHCNIYTIDKLTALMDFLKGPKQIECYLKRQYCQTQIHQPGPSWFRVECQQQRPSLGQCWLHSAAPQRDFLGFVPPVRRERENTGSFLLSIPVARSSHMALKRH